MTDRLAAISSLSTFMSRQGGLNRDRLSLVNLQERIALSGGGDNPRHKVHVRTPGTDLLMRTEEEEKKRIAQELHDGLGQLLTSINLHVQQCLNGSGDAADLSPSVKDSLQMISDMAKQAMGEVRGICGALRPAILDDLGVVAAIKWQCRQLSQVYAGLVVAADIDVSEATIPDRYKTAIYRIVQEAMNNAVKHAEARKITVSLRRVGEDLQLFVQDDGVGFDVLQGLANAGMGLMSMRERVESAGGFFELRSAVGQGVEIRVSFPVEKVALSG